LTPDGGFGQERCPQKEVKRAMGFWISESPSIRARPSKIQQRDILARGIQVERVAVVAGARCVVCAVDSVALAAQGDEYEHRTPNFELRTY